MQFISADPLVRKFRNGTFDESEVGPYFMLYMILLAISGAIVTGETDSWGIASGIAFIALATITGGDKALDPAGCLFFIGFEVAFYWWLGALIGKCRGPTLAVADLVGDPAGAGGHPI